MTTDEQPTAPDGEPDLDLYAIGADIPDGAAVVLVTEIDNPIDEVDSHLKRFIGRWATEDEVSKIWDGYVYIRLRRADAETVDAELILAHDGQLIPVVRLANTTDWAEQLRLPANAIMTLHTDLESGDPCKDHADGVAPH
ncbi:hypothetical protein Caci_4041 [Catenulispora acidiphila DSM 44928]|uniref:Uncharacterized protein n=1 Tax=Catenulispora acidiphila (strain DSM 44928 / JCM 14897 / NBRC 102108 / NRRL B-24433 / ID139908) TaxID=479433 RepID=C7QG64_CATAD|nr:hypothetical protein [Catenulispora acidiphila]ACU72909.1 hypothetical protein Caci_4041 [Catenulispora acidiphila DSM 44928]